MNSDDDMELPGKKKSEYYGGLFKFSSSNEQWKIDSISSKMKELELNISIQAKIYNNKIGKWIHNTFNMVLKLDEPNIQNVTLIGFFV
jgi:hypothetical protein